MIQIEYLNDGTLVKHYSDAGFLLLQNETGVKYSEPIDIVPCPYTYTETDELIDNEDNYTEITPEEYENILQEQLKEEGEIEYGN